MKIKLLLPLIAILFLACEAGAYPYCGGYRGCYGGGYGYRCGYGGYGYGCGSYGVAQTAVTLGGIAAIVGAAAPIVAPLVGGYGGYGYGGCGYYAAPPAPVIYQAPQPQVIVIQK